MKVFLFIPALVFFVFASCTGTMHKQDIESYFTSITDPTDSSLIRYAHGFDIFQKDGITKIVVFHPEQNELVVGTYYLTDSLTRLNFRDTSNIFIRPVNRVAVFSTTQSNAFDLLNELDRIVGISEAGYIKNESVKKKIENGDIVELAGSGNFFIERTLVVKPSMIFYSPYRLTDSHPLEITKIPLIPFFDFYETDPLGRAEWIRFSAAFLGQEKMADSIFGDIVSQYDHFKEIASHATKNPSVFSDKYFNGQWYVPGGESYIAKIFEDAGADYIWKNDEHNASFPLDYEVVYSKAYDADYWRIVGSYGEEASYDALAADNGLYQHFKAFADKKVIWCDAENTAYFEKSSLEPHWVLADFIKAFHPSLLPGYTPHYYKILE